MLTITLDPKIAEAIRNEKTSAIAPSIIPNSFVITTINGKTNDIAVIAIPIKKLKIKYKIAVTRAHRINLVKIPPFFKHII